MAQIRLHNSLPVTATGAEWRAKVNEMWMKVQEGQVLEVGANIERANNR